MPREAGRSELDGFIRALLILIGIGVGVWAMWQWTDTGKGAGSRTSVTEATSPAPLPGQSPAPSSEVVTTVKERKHSTTTKTSTFGAPASKTTTTTGPSIDAHSEAITLALLGIAGLFVLTGVFWGGRRRNGNGGNVLAFHQAAAAAEKTTRWLSGLDWTVRWLPSRDALGKTNEQLARLSSRVEALEQGVPSEEIAPAMDQYVRSRPQLAEIAALAQEPHPGEAELDQLRADADRAVIDLTRHVDGVRD